MGQEFRDEDARAAGWCLGDAGDLDGRQREALEMEEDVVFAAGDLERQLLERVQHAVRDEEPDEMSRRADRHMAEGEAVARPGGERQLPRQVDEVDRRVAKAEVRKPGHGRGIAWTPGRAGARAQRRFRKYAATDPS